MKSLDYGKEYRYAHDEREAYAAVQLFSGSANGNPLLPACRSGLEIKIKEKVKHCKNWIRGKQVGLRRETLHEHFPFETNLKSNYNVITSLTSQRVIKYGALNQNRKVSGNIRIPQPLINKPTFKQRI